MQANLAPVVTAALCGTLAPDNVDVDVATPDNVDVSAQAQTPASLVTGNGAVPSPVSNQIRPRYYVLGGGALPGLFGDTDKPAFIRVVGDQVERLALITGECQGHAWPLEAYGEEPIADGLWIEFDPDNALDWGRLLMWEVDRFYLRGLAGFAGAPVTFDLLDRYPALARAVSTHSSPDAPRFVPSGAAARGEMQGR